MSLFLAFACAWSSFVECITAKWFIRGVTVNSKIIFFGLLDNILQTIWWQSIPLGRQWNSLEKVILLFGVISLLRHKIKQFYPFSKNSLQWWTCMRHWFFVLERVLLQLYILLYGNTQKDHFLSHVLHLARDAPPSTTKKRCKLNKFWILFTVTFYYFNYPTEFCLCG